MRVLEVREPRPELALGQEQVPQAPLARDGLHLFENRDRLPAVPGVDLLVEAGLVRIDVLVHERHDLVEQLARTIGKGKEHLRYLVWS